MIWQIPFAIMEEKLESLDLGLPVLYAGREAFACPGKLLEGRVDA